MDTLKLDNEKKLDKMTNLHKKELEAVRTECESKMEELKVENVKMVERQLCKAEEERNILISKLREEKTVLETRNQKLSAFVDNIMTGPDTQDKFVNVSNLFPTFSNISFQRN